MKTASRILAMLLCLALVLSACGGGKDPAPDVSNPDSSSTASSNSYTAGGIPNTLIGPTGCEIGGGIMDTIAQKKTGADTLEVIMGQDSGNIDPANNALIVGIMAEKHFYDTLIMKDPITGDFIPGLATAWEWIDDTHLKVTLREGVTFHDGSAMTAEDVLYSMNRLPEGSSSGTLYASWSPEESSIVSATEVIVGFSTPFAPALNYLAHTRASIVSKAYMEAHGPEAIYQTAMGTGAYKFVQWNTGSDMTLERFDDWWGIGEYGDCYFKNIHITYSSEEGARAIALESGSADIAFTLSAADYERIFAGGVDHVLATGQIGIQANAVVLNFSNEALQKLEVRQAMAYSVDWPAAVDASGGISWAENSSGIAPAIFGYINPGHYEYNPDKSKELLAEAGYADGLTLTCTIAEGSATKLFEIIQAYFADVGITLEISITDNATWRQNCDDGLCDVSIGNMTALTLDPSHALFYTFSSNNPENVGNVGAYNERYYELWYEGMAELDTNKRAEIYAEMQQMLFDEVLLLPMYVPFSTYGYWDYLDGVIPDAGQQLDCRLITLKTA